MTNSIIKIPTKTSSLNSLRTISDFLNTYWALTKQVENIIGINLRAFYVLYTFSQSDLQNKCITEAVIKKIGTKIHFSPSCMIYHCVILIDKKLLVFHDTHKKPYYKVTNKGFDELKKINILLNNHKISQLDKAIESISKFAKANH